METKDLQREIMDADRLAERGRMVLELNAQVVNLTRENEQLAAELDAARSELNELKGAGTNA